MAVLASPTGRRYGKENEEREACVASEDRQTITRREEGEEFQGRHHGSATLGRTSAFAVFQGQRNLEWVYLKNSPLSILLRSLPGHLLYTAAAAGYFARLGLLGAFLRAKLAAVAGVPRVLRQRAVVQRTRRVGAGAIWSLLERRWLATKLSEKRFDVGLAGAVSHSDAAQKDAVRR